MHNILPLLPAEYKKDRFLFSLLRYKPEDEPLPASFELLPLDVGCPGAQGMQKQGMQKRRDIFILELGSLL